MPLSVRLKHDKILSKLEKQAQHDIIKIGEKEVRRLVNLAQIDMLRFFDSHPITQEIKGGAGANNLSGVIGGNGNLFSFIGFYKGDDPTAPLREVLSDTIRIDFLGALKRGPKASDFRFRAYVPTLNFGADGLIGKIEGATPLPWSAGESWATMMKYGIPGIGQYLFVETTSSRSGAGLQNPKVSRSKTFTPTDYIGEIFKSFINSLNERAA